MSLYTKNFNASINLWASLTQTSSTYASFFRLTNVRRRLTSSQFYDWRMLKSVTEHFSVSMWILLACFFTQQRNAWKAYQRGMSQINFFSSHILLFSTSFPRIKSDSVKVFMHAAKIPCIHFISTLLQLQLSFLKWIRR